MDNAVVNLIGGVLGGAAAGYITNDYAVKMLFKKYGPIGGVVVKEREKFSKSIGEIVERDLLNHHTIGNELKKDGFKRNLRLVVEDLLRESLPNKVNGMYLNDIKDYEISENKSKKTINSYLKSNVYNSISELTKNIELSSFINDNQIENISEKLVGYSLEILRDQKLIVRFLKDLYEENESTQIKDILGKNFIPSFSESFRKNNSEFHEELKLRCNDDIDNLFQIIYKEFAFTEIISELEHKIKDKTLKDYLGETNINELSKTVVATLKSFIESSEGIRIIDSFSENIVFELKAMDSSLYSFLEDGVGKESISFLKPFVHEFLEKLISIVKGNKYQLEAAIKEAIAEAIRNRNGLQQKFLDFFKDRAYREIIDNYGVMGKLINYFEENKHTSSEQLSEEIINKLENILKEKNISEIIIQLEKEGLFSVSGLSKIIYDNVRTYINNIDSFSISKIFDIKIGSVIAIDLKNYFEETIYSQIVNLVKERYIYTNKFTTLINGEICKIILEINEKSLKELLKIETLEEMDSDLNLIVFDKLNLVKDKLKVELSKYLKELLNKKSLDDLLNNEQKIIIGDNLYKSLEKKVELKSFGNTNLEIKLEELNSKDNITEKISNFVSETIEQNLEIVLKGNISNGIYKNLSNLEDKEIQKMVENFMGKELAPINIFGAILGAGVGAVMPIIPQSNIIINASAFAGIGVLTNVIALDMIFKPYEPMFKIGNYVHQGVISKQKNSFAESMGKFVGEELLTKESINDIFESKRDSIISSTKNSLTSNDYKILKTGLYNYSDKIVEVSSSILIGELIKSKSSIIEAIIEEIKYMELSKIDFSSIKVKIQESITEGIKTNKYIENKIKEFFGNDKSLDKVIPDFVSKEIVSLISYALEEKLNILIDEFKNPEKLKENINRFSDKFEEIKNKKISDFLSNSDIEIMKNKLFDFMYLQVQSPNFQLKILNLINQKIQIELAPERKINQIFNGELIRFVEKTSGNILDLLIDDSLRKLESTSYSIKDSLKSAVRDHLDGGKLGKFGGFFKNLGASAVGTYEVADDTVDVLIRKKIPEFLNSQKSSIHSSLKTTISNIGKENVSNLGLEVSRDKIESSIKKIIENEKIKSIAKSGAFYIFDKFSEREFNFYLKSANIKSIGNLSTIFKDEIDYTINHFEKTIYMNKDNCFKLIASNIYSISEKTILSKSFKEYTSKISVDDLSYLSRNINNTIVSSISVSKVVENFINIFVEEKISEKRSSDFISLSILEKDMALYFESLTKNPVILAFVRNEISNFIINYTENLHNTISLRTMEHVIEIFLEPFVDSFSKYSVQIIESIDFRKITEEEIRNMNPREIHKLFDSFAKDYFLKLKVYGVLGAVFGIHTYVSLPLMGLYGAGKVIKKVD